ncbi:MAG: hypothetical protein LBT14_13835 [Treponema sp.]|jgi:hypothetical protein|nr:hypothetical protein [Treponema sp.]
MLLQKFSLPSYIHSPQGRGFTAEQGKMRKIDVALERRRQCLVSGKFLAIIKGNISHFNLNIYSSTMLPAGLTKASINRTILRRV